MAMIEVWGYNTEKICGASKFRFDTGKAVGVLDNTSYINPHNTSYINPDDEHSKQFPKTLLFEGKEGGFMYVHLSPQDVKKLREWALQQSLNEL